MGQCLVRLVHRISGEPLDLTGSMVDIRAGFCNADPITNYGKKVQRIQIMVIPFIPMALLWILIIVSIDSGRKSLETINHQHQLLNGADILGDAIHDLQIERSIMLLHTGCRCEISTHRLKHSFIATEQSLIALKGIPLSYWLMEGDIWASPDALRIYLLDNRQLFLVDLGRNTSEIRSIYDSALLQIRKTLDRLVKLIEKRKVWTEMASFVLLHLASEKSTSANDEIVNAVMKAEKLSINVTFGDTRFSYEETNMVSKQCIQIAKQYSRNTVIYYNRFYYSDKVLVNKIDNIHKCVMSDNCDQSSTFPKKSVTPASVSWIISSLEVCDSINDIGKLLIKDMDIVLDDMYSVDSNWLALNIVAAILSIFVAPILIAIMWNITNYIQNFSVDLSQKTKKLRKEKKKSDNLLYQMLPKSVALQLKLSKKVSAENFNRVTLFFSDVVGFTGISAKCSPMQVVDFLNALYHMFDTTIGKYDVYKVETIGDAYMIVSGLPQRNGNRHVGEIAGVSLHLLRDIKKFRIPHIPDERITLRIGLHTGGVVAGVVGTKMPRFCLFGETVNMASLMESNGVAMKIQITPECKNALEELGGYIIESRGEIEIKGSGMMTTYFMTGKSGVKSSNLDI